MNTRSVTGEVMESEDEDFNRKILMRRNSRSRSVHSSAASKQHNNYHHHVNNNHHHHHPQQQQQLKQQQQAQQQQPMRNTGHAQKSTATTVSLLSLQPLISVSTSPTDSSSSSTSPNPSPISPSSLVSNHLKGAPPSAQNLHSTSSTHHHRPVPRVSSANSVKKKHKIEKTIVQNGVVNRTPKDSYHMVINYTVHRRLKKGKVLFVEQGDAIEFIYGDGELFPVIEACIADMRLREMSLFTCKIDKMSDQESSEWYRHTPELIDLLRKGDCKLEIIIEILSFMSEEEIWWNRMIDHNGTFDGHTLFMQTLTLKQSDAASFYAARRYKLAAKRLQRAFDIVESYRQNAFGLTDTMVEDVRKLTTKLLGDLAAAYNMSDDHDAVIETCTVMLFLNPNNEEALFTRANAFRAKNNIPYAVLDYQKALQICQNEQLRSTITNNIQRLSYAQYSYDIEITGVSTVEDRTVYVVHVKNDSLGIDCLISRRYSDFRKMYDKLCLKYPKFASEVTLPQGKWFRSFTQTVINDRKDKFEKMLQFMAKSDLYCGTEEFIQFISRDN